ncbi:MAG: hypothetical protein JW781_01125 [Deltaproteobacteria bacterium]|nr:hypothetical protein [Candidatus Anaeroferrophillacea bacterium]
MNNNRLIPLIVLILLFGAVAFGHRYFRPAAPETADVIVTFADGGRFTAADLDAHRRVLQRKPQFRRGADQLTPEFVLDHAVNMATIVAEARRLGLFNDPRVQSEINQFTADLVLRVMKTELVAEIDRTRVTDDEVRRHYEANRDRYGAQNLEERREYIRNDVLLRRYRDAWQQTYDRLRREHGVVIDAAASQRYFAADTAAAAEREPQAADGTADPAGNGTAADGAKDAAAGTDERQGTAGGESGISVPGEGKAAAAGAEPDTDNDTSAPAAPENNLDNADRARAPQRQRPDRP